MPKIRLFLNFYIPTVSDQRISQVKCDIVINHNAILIIYNKILTMI